MWYRMRSATFWQVCKPTASPLRLFSTNNLREWRSSLSSSPGKSFWESWNSHWIHVVGLSCFPIMEWRPHFLCHSGNPGCIGDAFKGRRDAGLMLMLGMIVFEWRIFVAGKCTIKEVFAKVGFMNSNIFRAKWMIEGFTPKKTSCVIP